MKEFGMKPRIHTCAAYADRKIPLEDHSLGMSIFTHFRKLSVKVVLNETPEIDLCLIFSTEVRYLLPIIFGISFPLREIRSIVPVSEDAECCIWKKPRSILLHKHLIILGSGKVLESLVESLLEKGCLSMVHFLVVDLIQGVKPLL
jgi:hypothetical protein